MEFNLADLFEAVVDAVPDRTAVVAGDRRLTYRELDERANRVAHYLRDVGVVPGQHVGIYSFNRVEWVEIMLGCFKARAVPINVNYRYVIEELRYLFDNADLVALFFESEFGPHVGAVLSGVPKLQHLVRLDDGTGTESSRQSTRSSTNTALVGRRPDARRAAPPLPRRPLRPVHGRDHRDAEGRHVARRGHLLRGDGRRELRRRGNRAAGRHRQQPQRDAGREPGARAADARERAVVV